MLDEVHPFGKTNYEHLKVFLPGRHNSFLGYKYVCFVNYVPENHFGLIVVENESSTPVLGSSSKPNNKYTIINYDSLVPNRVGGSRTQSKDRLAEAKLKFMQIFYTRIYDEFKIFFTILFDIIDKGLMAAQQKNGYDCGIFVCMKKLFKMINQKFIKKLKYKIYRIDFFQSLQLFRIFSCTYYNIIPFFYY